MKLLDNLKMRARNLKSLIVTIYYAYQNPKTRLLPKIIILFTLGYALSPIDLIPDFIPVIGYLDDLIIIPALISLSIKLIPKEIIDEARHRAEKEPLRLGKNWVFGSIFILIWIVLLILMIRSICRLIKH